MAVEGGGTPDTYWDEARVALGRVLWAMNDNPEVSPETLRALENYEAIPLPVREALESLSPDERRVVTKMGSILAEHHFYLEHGDGGLRWF
jgi:hypothetical protein